MLSVTFNDLYPASLNPVKLIEDVSPPPISLGKWLIIVVLKVISGKLKASLCDGQHIMMLLFRIKKLL